MSSDTRTEVWGCWLCGFKITRLHDPFAVRVTSTNLHMDRECPATPWQDVFAHAECMAERMPMGHFDAEVLADKIPSEEFESPPD